MEQKFNELINLKKQPDSTVAVFLKKMVDEYPYCQPARMLLTRALIQGNKRFYEYQRNIASAIAPDVRIFNDFLNGHHPTQWQKNAESTAEVTEAPGPQQVLEKPLEDKTATIAERKRRQQEIIDRFLELNPRIEVRGKDIPEGDIAAESIEYKPGVASETLAEIMLRQGKKEEAAMIYNKLSLMFPEKSSYFAKKLKSI